MFELFALFCAFSLAVAQQKNCYYPNGTDTNQANNIGPVFQECGSFDTHSMCCRRNTHDRPDKCRADGLCENALVGHLWRESCTDPLWEAEGCLQLCINGTAQIKKDGPVVNMADTHVQIKTCNNGSFCCGSEDSPAAMDCCDRGQGVWIVKGKVQSHPPNATSSTPSSTSSSAFLSSPTTSSSFVLSSIPSIPSNARNISNDKNAIIGGVIGGVGGALTLVVGLLWYLLRRLRKRENASTTKENELAPPQIEQTTYELGVPPLEIGEASATELAAEIETEGRARRELLA